MHCSLVGRRGGLPGGGFKGWAPVPPPPPPHTLADHNHASSTLSDLAGVWHGHPYLRLRRSRAHRHGARRRDEQRRGDRPRQPAASGAARDRLRVLPGDAGEAVGHGEENQGGRGGGGGCGKEAGRRCTGCRPGWHQRRRQQRGRRDCSCPARQLSHAAMRVCKVIAGCIVRLQATQPNAYTQEQCRVTAVARQSASGAQMPAGKVRGVDHHSLSAQAFAI